MYQSRYKYRPIDSSSTLAHPLLDDYPPPDFPTDEEAYKKNKKNCCTIS